VAGEEAAVVAVGLGVVAGDRLLDVELAERDRAAGEQRRDALGHAPAVPRDLGGHGVEAARARQAAVAVDGDRLARVRVGPVERLLEARGVEAELRRFALVPLVLRVAAGRGVGRGRGESYGDQQCGD